MELSGFTFYYDAKVGRTIGSGYIASIVKKA
jgi:hypothetical protein